jgi:uncharacterized membrane protein YfcA
MLYEGLFAKTVSPQQIGSIPGRTIWKSFLGSIIGILTGIIGLGGGYALVPSFIYFLNAPVRLAIGTSMASFVWIAFVGAIFKFFQGVVNIPAASALGIGAIGGAILGARLTGKFKPNVLKTLFGVIFLYVALKYILIYFGLAI